jgi:hypothetical protein
VTTNAALRDRGLLLVVAGLVVVLVASAAAIRALIADDAPGADWVRVGSVQDVRAQGVVPLPELRAYVVADLPRTPFALSARSPHLGERIVYCRSSTWFQDRHGDTFDHLGNYAFGPSPRGMDRLATLVRDGTVWVDPTNITVGLPRGPHQARPAGAICPGLN